MAVSIDSLLLKSVSINFFTPGISIFVISRAYTSASNSTSNSAVAFPIPDAAPVTTHILFLYPK